MTIREAISRLKGITNSIKRDERITNQLAYSILRTTAEMLLKQDSRNKRLFQNLTNLSVFECEELEDVDLKTCIPIIVHSCRNLKQTTSDFSTPYFSFLNKPLLYVSSVDDSVEFIPSSPYEFAQTRRNEFKGRKQYYWFENGKIIFPDTEVDFVKIRGYFKEALTNSSGVLFLDQEFNIPAYLEKSLFELAGQEILSLNKRITKDENPNLNLNQK